MPRSALRREPERRVAGPPPVVPAALAAAHRCDGYPFGEQVCSPALPKES